MAAQTASAALSGLELDEFHSGDEHPMYVQRWRRAGSAPGPTAVLVHGGAHTGVCWTSTPDGRPGWARHLAARSWTAYVVDWPGTGRSPRADDYLTAGPMAVVESVAALVREVGPTVLIGHSIGAGLGVKVLDLVPQLVTAFLAVNPAAPGIVTSGSPRAPEDRSMWFDEAAARHLLASAKNFPTEAFPQYLRGLHALSPTIFNAMRTTDDGGEALQLVDRAAVVGVRSLVLAGDADALAPAEISRAVAELLACPHVTAGADWGLDGYGHMIPLEWGSEELLFRALETLGAVAEV